MKNDKLSSCKQGRDIFQMCNYYFDGKCHFDRDCDGQLPCDDYIDAIMDIYKEAAGGTK